MFQAVFPQFRQTSPADRRLTVARWALCLAGGLLLGLATESRAAEPIRVAIYLDKGTGEIAAKNLTRALPESAGFQAQTVSAEDIRAGVLKNFDVLIQPGGSGSGQAKELEVEGRDAIKGFVKNGGGYLGICAGAYLASADYSWSLHLLDAKVIDREHWARGTGTVDLKLSPSGCQFFATQTDLVPIYYGQGPLLAPAGKADIPDYEVLASYETEIAKKGAPTGVMKGTTAAARGTYGEGRVFVFSPHPEKTDGLDPFVQAATRWAAKAATDAPAKTSPKPVATTNAAPNEASNPPPPAAVAKPTELKVPATTAP